MYDKFILLSFVLQQYGITEQIIGCIAAGICILNVKTSKGLKGKISYKTPFFFESIKSHIYKLTVLNPLGAVFKEEVGAIRASINSVNTTVLSIFNSLVLIKKALASTEISFCWSNVVYLCFETKTVDGVFV